MYIPLAHVCLLGTSPPRKFQSQCTEKAVCEQGGHGNATSHLVGRQNAQNVQNCFHKVPVTAVPHTSKYIIIIKGHGEQLTTKDLSNNNRAW